MIDQATVNYIQKYILKKGEELETLGIDQTSSPFIDVKIVKRTERTYRVVGLLTLSPYKKETVKIDDSLKDLNFTPRKKVKLDDHAQRTLRWLEQGWIMKEIRFEKDEKTIKTMYYRMGYRLYQYQQECIQQKKDAIDREFREWKNTTKLIQINDDQIELFSYQRKRGFNSLIEVINKVLDLDFYEIEESYLFPEKWSLQKKLKFLHFVVAFLQLCLQKTNFDWKEIGASYFKKIGGSKKFDSNKQEFITHLEEWTKCPAALLGLSSLGNITPFYFSGQLIGNYSSYQFGPVHALTDLSISADDYSTKATTLWLVENRGILTRMNAEGDFIKETNSLVMCVDGHLRTSHKHCIHQLLKNSPIQQTMIWTDYDSDGFQIAKELYTVISPHRSLKLKWITHDHRIMEQWEMYEKYMTAFLKDHKLEQEQILGDVESWKRWINH
ncbi:DUF7281 domain-containing protein [Anoxybacteroides rupiense]|uniref:Toprim sub domain-containing protein n=1 Tax=Anoxybacteroides rupiense TaxID=311460 RepID=A0ABD5IXC0_9BACL|nr:Toprim sub domain-containing protein [Anoxybacillus rupiensis]MBB3906524.1 hypothetical protein [Anoxybacillus rupiensis]MED5052979.1 Toprim sub domain-containing protein [Anoxybacillus rupiensis]